MGFWGEEVLGKVQKGDSAHSGIPGKSRRKPRRPVCVTSRCFPGESLLREPFPRNHEEAELSMFPHRVGEALQTGRAAFPGGFPLPALSATTVSSAKKRGCQATARDDGSCSPLSLGFLRLQGRNLRLSETTFVWDSFLKRCSRICEDCQERV